MRALKQAYIKETNTRTAHSRQCCEFARPVWPCRSLPAALGWSQTGPGTCLSWLGEIYGHCLRSLLSTVNQTVTLRNPFGDDNVSVSLDMAGASSPLPHLPSLPPKVLVCHCHYHREASSELNKLPKIRRITAIAKSHARYNKLSREQQQISAQSKN